jgi:hypothetical protein
MVEKLMLLQLILATFDRPETAVHLGALRGTHNWINLAKVTLMIA